MPKLTIRLSKILKTKYRTVFKKAYWLLLLGVGFTYHSHPAIAQVSINQNTISQPLTIEGISGGSIAALEITQTENTATGYCDGFASRQPNHILKIDSFFKSLRLEVKSQSDTTIMVQGPGGIWCNDDVNNANPMIEGAWQPGIYKVWVGSYQANANNSYQIRITGRQ